MSQLKTSSQGLKITIAFLFAIFSLASLSGCTSAAAFEASKVTAIIDVRTVDEFNAGHLEGAVNMDVEATTFAEQISTLDKAGNYVLYCHSGRRAGLALDQMTSAGFSNLTNAGGLDEAASYTGLAVVQ